VLNLEPKECSVSDKNSAQSRAKRVLSLEPQLTPSGSQGRAQLGIIQGATLEQLGILQGTIGHLSGHRFAIIQGKARHHSGNNLGSFKEQLNILQGTAWHHSGNSSASFREQLGILQGTAWHPSRNSMEALT
jgi:hypothetical protein